MPLIQADGLFDGDRINSCSKTAQLYYPRMLAASNGFGRIRIDYRLIIAAAFPRWADADLPSEEELIAYFQEYADQRLLFLYSSAGQLWGQWDAKAGTFGKYQTVADKRSPAPPVKDFDSWVKENREKSLKPSVTTDLLPVPNRSATLPKSSRKPAAKVPHGVGVGVGEGVTCDVKGVGEKPSASATPRVRKSRPAQVSDATAQSRHSRIRELVTGWYQEWAGAECPWDGGEGANLSRMLEATPNWHDQQFVSCLENLARSDCVAKGTRPREWIEGLPKFLRGPLDRFWKPMGVGNGAGNSKAADRNARNREAIVRGSQGYRGGPTAVPDGPAVQPGDHAGTDGAVAGVSVGAHPKPGP